MNIAVLQHAVFEGPGEIAAWAKLRGHSIKTHQLYKGDPLPDFDKFGLLVVLGGEMNIYQYRDWPWLRAETDFIRKALVRGKRVVGICLGAQLLADALGSRVYQNANYEVGWFPVTWAPDAGAIFPHLKGEATVLHWHGDTYSTPKDAVLIGSSKGCVDQGFVIPGKCLALQFHLEVDPSIVEEFVKGQGDWPEGPYVQSPKAINHEAASHCDRNRAILQGMLDKFVA